jgi:AcrR family transcriptional regulator
MKDRSLLEEKKDWTKRAILAAAKRVFFQKGYLNTTVNEIATKARVSNGAIYLYFKSKDDLYLALMMPVMEEFGRALNDLERKLNDDQRMNGRTLIMEFLEVFKRVYKYDPDGIRIAQTFQIGNLTSKMTEKTSQEIISCAKRNRKVARNIICKAIKMRLIKKTNPAKLFDVLSGTFFGILQLEESKLRSTRKNYIFSTLEYAYLCIAGNLCAGRNIP